MNLFTAVWERAKLCLVSLKEKEEMKHLCLSTSGPGRVLGGCEGRYCFRGPAENSSVVPPRGTPQEVGRSFSNNFSVLIDTLLACADENAVR